MTADRGRPTGPIRTLFLGSGGFAVPILDALRDVPEVALVGVISSPDRPSGRRGAVAPVPVTRRARELGLPVLQPARLRDPGAVAEVAALDPGFGLLADYGQIVPRSVLEMPAHGILNVHPSALPRHRGASPIPATILAGDQVAAVTLMRMDEGLDTGPIVAQESWSLDGSATAESLEVEAARRGAALVRRSIGPWLAGRLTATPQAEVGVTLTRPLRREDGRLDPGQPAFDLERQIRAYVPWPGSFVDTELGRLIVHAAEAIDDTAGDRPGTIVADGDGLAFATADGRLRLHRVQLAGRRTTDAASLRRGAPGLVGLDIGLR